MMLVPVFCIGLVLLVEHSVGFVLTDNPSPDKLRNNSEKWTVAEDNYQDLNSLCKDDFGNDLSGPVHYQDDCSKFLICGPSTATLMSCSEGLLFNEELMTCDYPRHANCVEYEAKVITKLVIPADEIKW